MYLGPFILREVTLVGLQAGRSQHNSNHLGHRARRLAQTSWLPCGRDESGWDAVSKPHELVAFVERRPGRNSRRCVDHQ